MTEMSAAPAFFQQAVASLTSSRPRPEIELHEVQAPKRIAPWAYALAAEATGPAGDLATARLVLLYDPDSYEAWNGVLRLVVYLRASLDAEVAADPLLPAVGWSWLTDALESCGTTCTALGGTVTLTSSARFGEISGPPRTHHLELRSSWTPSDEHLEPHAAAFCELLASATGLPPEGVSVLNPREGAAPRHG
ncbi:MAG: DUF3000 domain-containing protein [Saccharopolyspora rectivirgula]